MSEGPTDGLARRGKRQTTIAAAIQDEVEMQEPPLLYPGARYEAKLSVNFNLGGRDAYVTARAEDDMQPGETDEDCQVRVGTAALRGLSDLASASEEEVVALQERFDSRRIQPRNR